MFKSDNVLTYVRAPLWQRILSRVGFRFSGFRHAFTQLPELEPPTLAYRWGLWEIQKDDDNLT